MKGKAFTLIELLIVVAIIAILAAIAVPNFLEAQVRSKVSRVKSDHRTIATALEAYCTDNNLYPGGRYLLQGDFTFSLIPLTTPVSYITSTHLVDPFSTGAPVVNGTDGLVIDFGKRDPTYFYFCFDKNSSWAQIVFSNPSPMADAGWTYRRAWSLTSPGPDHRLDHMTWAPVYFATPGQSGTGMNLLYDPTNGTVSKGDLGRFGGDIPVSALLN